MKKLLFLSLLFTTLSANAQKDKDSIQNAIVRFFDGLSAFDMTIAGAHTTSDFQLLEVGLVWNNDSLRVHLEPMKGKGVQRVNQFQFITTEQSGNWAWVSYHNRADFSFEGETQTVRWLESAVLVKERGRWRIRMMHSTRVADERVPKN